MKLFILIFIEGLTLNNICQFQFRLYRFNTSTPMTVLCEKFNFKSYLRFTNTISHHLLEVGEVKLNISQLMKQFFHKKRLVLNGLIWPTVV